MRQREVNRLYAVTFVLSPCRERRPHAVHRGITAQFARSFCGELGLIAPDAVPFTTNTRPEVTAPGHRSDDAHRLPLFAQSRLHLGRLCHDPGIRTVEAWADHGRNRDRLHELPGYQSTRRVQQAVLRRASPSTTPRLGPIGRESALVRMLFRAATTRITTESLTVAPGDCLLPHLFGCSGRPGASSRRTRSAFRLISSNGSRPGGWQTGLRGIKREIARSTDSSTRRISRSLVENIKKAMFPQQTIAARAGRR